MSSEIENFLFRGLGTHALLAFAVQQGELRVTLAPWTDLENKLEAVFNDAHLTSIEMIDADTDGMPWDIIAVSCDKHAEGGWQFFIHCDAIELGFMALWPEKRVA